VLQKLIKQDKKIGLTMENNDMTIEEGFKSLDEMIDKLEGDDISLEESFKIYENGMKLLKVINDKIDTVEKKMQMIDTNGQIGDFT
jgi:exodeoxyribonuclease VII small subunit